MKSLVQVLAYFLFFKEKVPLRIKIAELVYLQLLIKHDSKDIRQSSWAHFEAYGPKILIKGKF